MTSSYNVRVTGPSGSRRGGADITWRVEARSPLDALRVALLEALEHSVTVDDPVLQRALQQHEEPAGG